MQIALFISSSDAVQPGWLLAYLRSIKPTQIREMQDNLAKVCYYANASLEACSKICDSYNSSYKFLYKNYFVLASESVVSCRKISHVSISRFVEKWSCQSVEKG